MRQPLDFWCALKASSQTSIANEQVDLNRFASKLQRCLKNLRTVCERGPAARNWLEGFYSYPGIHALVLHRAAYWLQWQRFPIVPRLLAGILRFLAGTEINPHLWTTTKRKLNRDKEFSPPISNAVICRVVNISSPTGKLIYERLQELMVPCWSTKDGSVWVEVDNGTTAMLVRSTVQQFVASRQDLVNWLERCWKSNEI